MDYGCPWLLLQATFSRIFDDEHFLGAPPCASEPATAKPLRGGSKYLTCELGTYVGTICAKSKKI